MALSLDLGEGVFKEVLGWGQLEEEKGYVPAAHRLQHLAEDPEELDKDRGVNARILGRRHYFGKGVADRDFEEAAKWFGIAAELEDAEGQYQLARMYYDGKGVERSLAEHKHWLEKAVAHGHVEAQCTHTLEKLIVMGSPDPLTGRLGDTTAQSLLGSLYFQGICVPQSYQRAAEWYEMAAGREGAEAQRAALYLMDMYNNGQGVERNPTKSNKLQEKAVKFGKIPSHWSLSYQRSQALMRAMAL